MNIRDIYDNPCFIINLDRCPERLNLAKQRVRAAGFKDIYRITAVDAKNQGSLDAGWRDHGFPKFDSNDKEFLTYPGKQGCFLSHINLLRHIILKKIKITTVFEDDVQFHKNWNELAPQYYNNTPSDYEILYLGSQIDAPLESLEKLHIIRAPVFCTHAYVITLEGAKKLYNLLLNSPLGVKTIDCLIIDMMKVHMHFQTDIPFNWYVWNGRPFKDPIADIDPDWAKRNSGLVFQDPQFESDVRIWK